MRLIRALPFAAMALQAVAHAEDSDAPFRGIGFATCAEFSVWNEQGADSGYIIQWVYGYWSAYNRALSQTDLPMKNILDSTNDPDPLSAQLLAICKREPSLLVVFAADRVFNRLPDSSAGDQ